MLGGAAPPGRHPELREAAGRAYRTLVDSLRVYADEERAALVAAAAWSLVHGLALLILDGHFSAAQRDAGGSEEFVRRVLGSVRYLLAAQRSA
jgi:hypothetical protein